MKSITLALDPNPTALQPQQIIQHLVMLVISRTRIVHGTEYSDTNVTWEIQVNWVYVLLSKEPIRKSKNGIPQDVLMMEMYTKMVSKIIDLINY